MDGFGDKSFERLLNIWRHDRNLGDDTRAAVAIVRRNRMMLLLATPTILAGAILALVIAHMITD